MVLIHERSYVIEVAFRWFADCLARHRCGPCARQDSHDVCDQPDWNRLGAEVLARLNQVPMTPEPIRIDDDASRGGRGDGPLPE